MKRADELKNLSKEVNISLSECEKIITMADEAVRQTQYAVGEKDGRYFLFQKDRGDAEYPSVAKELDKEEWDTDYSLLRYTPDDIHTYRIPLDNGNITAPKPLQLTPEEIHEGMSCTFAGVTLTYKDPKHILVETDDKYRILNVKENDKYDYKYNGHSGTVQADGGAKGYFARMDNKAEKCKIDCSLFTLDDVEIEFQFIADTFMPSSPLATISKNNPIHERE